MYHAEIAGVKWPSAGVLSLHRLQGREILSAADRLAKIMDKNSSEFFVVTRQSGFSKQPDLVDVLERGFSVFASTQDYVIFDLRFPRE